MSVPVHVASSLTMRTTESRSDASSNGGRSRSGRPSPWLRAAGTAITARCVGFQHPASAMSEETRALP
ncbi:MAG: hypothetical protein QM820_51695 [Minicystis sp.]